MGHYCRLLLFVTITIAKSQIAKGNQIATFVCPEVGMDIAINPGTDKMSKIAVLGAENEPGCFASATQNMYYLRIEINNTLTPPCGIKRSADGTLTTYVATQAYSNAYAGSDRIYKVQCKLGQVLMAQTAGMMIDGTVQSGTALQHDSSMVRMEFRDVPGTRTLTQAAIGDVVVLHLSLKPNTVYKGMDVERCVAYDRADKTGASMVILDNGCGTGEVIGSGKGFYRLPRFEENTLVSTPIELFRFIQTPYIMVECQFTKFCTTKDMAVCEQSCNVGGIARRRRRAVTPANSTAAALLVLPGLDVAKNTQGLSREPSKCVDQMAIILTVLILGGLLVASTGAVIWFCTRMSRDRQTQRK